MSSTGGFGHSFRDGDWKRLRQIIQKLASIKLGPHADAIFKSLTLDSLNLGLLNLTGTTLPQLTVGYDLTHKLTLAVDAAGDVDIGVSGGDIDFGTVNLLTTGTLGAGNTTLTGYLSQTGGGILSTGTTTGYTIPSGAGTRLMWIPDKNAFRAGSALTTEWNTANIGSWSYAFGYRVKASGSYSLCTGNFGDVSGLYSACFNYGGQVVGESCVHFGALGDVTGNFSSHFGSSGVVSGNAAAHFGSHGLTDCSHLLTLGRYNIATGGNATTWVDTDPLIVCGNGTGEDALRSNSLVVYKNGNILTPGTLGAGIGTLTSLNLTADTNQIVLNSDGGVAAITLTGTAATSAKTITFPNATGTVALTSDLGAYLPLAGGTMTGNLLFTDATYDIGASGATRPRDLFLSRNAVLGGNITAAIGRFTTSIKDNAATPLISIDTGNRILYASSGINVGVNYSMPGGICLISGPSTPVIYSVFAGDAAGYLATYATESFFFGINTGNTAVYAENSIFLAGAAGFQATYAKRSIFIGNSAGYQATYACESIFNGVFSGYQATNASDSIFLGHFSGNLDTVDNRRKGGIDSVDVDAAGSGYEVSEVLTLVGGNSDATVTITEVGGSGEVIEIDIADVGTGYWTIRNLATTGGSGSGCKVGVLAVTNDTLPGTSICIGRYSGTGGYKDSVAIGHGVKNSAINEMNLGNVMKLTGIYASDTPSSAYTAGGGVAIGKTLGVTGLSTLTGGADVGASATKLSVEADGDTFWVGAGTGLPYGSFYGNELSATYAVNNSYMRIADAGCVTGEVNLTTYTVAGTTLTISKAGRYLITWAVACASSVANTHVLGGIMIDSTTVLLAEGRNHFEQTAAGRQLAMSGTAIISCPNGTEVIGVGVGSDANVTLTVDHVNLSIIQVGG